MATNLFLSTSLLSPNKVFSHKSVSVTQKPVRFATIKSNVSVSPTANSHVSVPPSLIRRSADYSYKPSIWDYNYLQSLKSNFSVEKHERRAKKLKEEVKMVFENFAETDDQLVHFELIDDLLRLGLAYHFEEEINNLLESLYISRNTKLEMNNDLHSTALEFRLFRQHGYQISQDTFKMFVDDKGCFKEALQKDVQGMLSLYEASYFSFEGENLMKEALHFTTEALKELSGKVDENLSQEIKKPLDLPLRWRSPRFEVRRFIDAYERRVIGMNPILLELAKLDFNLLQGSYQDELRNQSRWWNNVGLVEKMGFARDRIVESYLWSVGTSPEPQFKLQRKILTRVYQLVTLIDDVYDVYGTLDELELFTDAVERWDINEMTQLPNYMKICFVALYNFVNERVFDILKDQNLDILPYLKKGWVDLVKAYLVEARWYNRGYKPTLDEYMENSRISIGFPLAILHGYIGAPEPIKTEALEFLASEPDIVRSAASIFRIADDCCTSADELKRGDTLKSIQCYMNEAGVSEEVAREHMTYLMRMGWEKVNKYRFANSPLPSSFFEMILNLVRTGHCMYHNGDVHGVQDAWSIDVVSALLFRPIPL